MSYNTPSDSRLICGIVVPVDEWDGGRIPRDCKGVQQFWADPFYALYCCITKDEKEMLVYPKTMADTSLDWNAEDERVIQMTFSMKSSMRQSLWIQSIEPHSHPSIQQCYGSNANGLTRYEAAIGRLSFFVAMYPGLEIIKEPIRYRWAWQLLSALAFLHKKGLVFNRLGLQKIWLKHDLSLLLCNLRSVSAFHVYDFQRIYMHDPGPPDDDCYTAVEINPAMKLDIDIGYPEIDIYGFASIFYFLLTGIQLHKVVKLGDGPESVLSNITNQAAQEIIKRSWNHEYNDIAEVVRDLRRTMEGIGMQFDDDDNVIGLDSSISELQGRFYSS